MSGIRVSILNDLSAMGVGPQNMMPCTSCKKLKRACIDDGHKPNGSCKHCRKMNKRCSYNNRLQSDVLFIQFRSQESNAIHRDHQPERSNPGAETFRPLPDQLNQLNQTSGFQTTVNWYQLAVAPSYLPDVYDAYYECSDSEELAMMEWEIMYKEHDELQAAQELDFVMKNWLRERHPHVTSLKLDELLYAWYAFVQCVIDLHEGTD